MAERETDAHTGVETTGHEWDGIRELDNPLPRWWLIIFYGTVAFALIYWALMPAWPLVRSYTPGLLHYSDRAKVLRDLAQLKAQRAAEGAKLQNASLEAIEQDPSMQAYALAVGQSIFGDNCATCHGAGGLGGKGYPNLRAGVWLWGGSLEDIQRTITYGVRSGDPKARVSQMPSFGRDEILKPEQIDDLTEYVVSLSHRPANVAAVRRAAPVFAANCAVCHGADGHGNRQVGAPNLADGGRQWLYGSDRASIHDQIWNGRGGVMPAWGHRFDANTIKALAVYIHANAGGQ
ncbi:MAG: cytochrome-c oxidase, cbb3-type subunit III [Caulobacteraceae bacterium]|nr:cytochrome-c oxidase, cbb3-type subunit III [Caulobacteraceae bacterium]